MKETETTEFDILDPEGLKRAAEYDQEKPYEETELPDCASAAITAKDAAEEALEAMYSNEFPIDDPPDSWERFEAELTLRHLATAAENWGHAAPDEEQIVELTLDEDTPERLVELKMQQRARFIKLAKTNIDTMATYGQVAEENLAFITSSKNVDLEIKEYAAETIAELREEKANEPKSLTAAIREWWHGE